MSSCSCFGDGGGVCVNVCAMCFCVCVCVWGGGICVEYVCNVCMYVFLLVAWVASGLTLWAIEL